MNCVRLGNDGCFLYLYVEHVKPFQHLFCVYQPNCAMPLGKSTSRSSPRPPRRVKADHHVLYVIYASRVCRELLNRASRHFSAHDDDVCEVEPLNPTWGTGAPAQNCHRGRPADTAFAGRVTLGLHFQGTAAVLKRGSTPNDGGCHGCHPHPQRRGQEVHLQPEYRLQGVYGANQTRLSRTPLGGCVRSLQPSSAIALTVLAKTAAY